MAQPGAGFPIDLERLAALIQSQGMDRVSRQIARSPGSLEARRRMALFLGGLRGHKISASDLTEHSGGFRGACRRCQQTIHVPRVVEFGDDGIQGRATEYDCPSTTKDHAG